jgi:hypothetical protein
MFCFLTYLVVIIFNLRKSRKDLLIQITVLQKEVEILRRSKGQNRLWIKNADRVILAILNSILISRIQSFIHLLTIDAELYQIIDRKRGK